jgi:hypothetical protein
VRIFSWVENLDVDVVVEGDAIRFAEASKRVPAAFEAIKSSERP